MSTRDSSFSHALQDLVLWFKQHNLLLRGPEGSVQEVYNAVLANITEEEAASQTVPE